MTDVKIQTKEEILNVSYSKAQAFKTCKFKFQQAHVVMHNPDAKKPGLMPKHKSRALARGSHGHAIMERFMKNVKEQLTFPYPQDRCTELIGEAVAWGIGENAEYSMEINSQIMHFGANVFPFLGWRILEIEKEYRLKVGVDEATGIIKVIPMTIDFVGEDQLGNVIVVDWKFSADAYSDTRCEIEPQIPIYIGVLRAHKIPATHGFYFFFRTRKMKNVEEQVVKKIVKPNNIRVRTAFQEHLTTAQEILEFQTQHKLPTRNSNNNCDYCDFSRLCAVSMRGDDISVMIQADFEPNEYGYDEE
jgi:hypothetical protein